MRTLYHTKRSFTTNDKSPARWIGRIYPSGAFACGRIPPPKERHHYNPELLAYKKKICKHRVYSGDGTEYTVSEQVYFQHKRTGKVMGHTPPDPNRIIEIHQRFVLSNAVTPEGLTNKNFDVTENLLGSGGGESQPALGSSTVPSSRIRARQGLKGITADGRKWVREGCCVMEAKFRKQNVGFFTLTLPYRGEALKEICRNWGKIVHRYFEELEREYVRRGQPLNYVAVVELQEKRYATYGEVAPHLHYIANAKVGKKFILQSYEIRGIFERVCSRFVSESADFSACENCQIIKKSSASYLSKYFSKGSATVSRLSEDDRELCPKRWWKCHKATLAAVRADTCVLYDSAVWAFIYEVRRLSLTNPELYTCEEIYVKVSADCEIFCGVWGKVESKYSRSC